MPAKRTLNLTPSDKAALEEMRDHDPKAYMRERAAALLKINDGYSAHHVAKHGLRQERDPDTVYAWLNRYEERGIEGLKLKKGRGRKPAFSP